MAASIMKVIMWRSQRL